MRFKCEECGARFAVADEKVAGRIVKMKCKKCGAIIRIDGMTLGKEQPEPLKTAEAEQKALPKKEEAPRQDPKIWHTAINKVRFGPYTLAELKEQFKAGKITKKTYIWKKGFSGWNVIMNVPEVCDCIEEKKAPAQAAHKEPVAKPVEHVEHKAVEHPAKRQVPDTVKKELEKAGYALKEKSAVSTEEKEQAPVTAPTKKPAPEPVEEPEGVEITKPSLKRPEKGKAEKAPATIEVAGIEKAPRTQPIPKDKSLEKTKSAKKEKVVSGADALFAVSESSESVEPEESPIKSGDEVSDLLAVIREVEGKVSERERQREVQVEKASKPVTEEIKDDTGLIAESEDMGSLFDDEEEIPPEAPRESTKIFILAAGVSKTQRFRKSLLYVASALGVVFAVLYFLSTFKVIDISQIAQTITGGKSEKDDTIASSAVDANALFGTRPAGGAKAGKKKAARKKQPLNAEGETGSAAEAEEGEEETAEGTAENTEGSADGLPSLSNYVVGESALPQLPDDLERRKPTDEFDPKTANAIIQRSSMRLRNCYENALKKDASIRGTVLVTLTISGEGNVARVDMDRSNISGTSVESCIKDNIKRWKFPRFKKSEAKVSFPMTLQPTF